jgi:hypothetical protein
VASSLPVEPLTDDALSAQVAMYARCADSGLDADEWFPVSTEAGRAREEAAAAIAVCSGCLVRAQCLALSLRHWDIGQHGVWGGLVAADRARLRRRLPTGRRGRSRAAVSRMIVGGVVSQVPRRVATGGTFSEC